MQKIASKMQKALGGKGLKKVQGEVYINMTVLTPARGFF